MKVSIEEKRAEAIKRMKAFGFFHEAIELFEADGTPLSSEPPWGAFLRSGRPTESSRPRI